MIIYYLKNDECFSDRLLEIHFLEQKFTIIPHITQMMQDSFCASKYRKNSCTHPRMCYNRDVKRITDDGCPTKCAKYDR